VSMRPRCSRETTKTTLVEKAIRRTLRERHPRSRRRVTRRDSHPFHSRTRAMHRSWALFSNERQALETRFHTTVCSARKWVRRPQVGTPGEGTRSTRYCRPLCDAARSVGRLRDRAARVILARNSSPGPAHCRAQICFVPYVTGGARGAGSMSCARSPPAPGAERGSRGSAIPFSDHRDGRHHDPGSVRRRRARGPVPHQPGNHRRGPPSSTSGIPLAGDDLHQPGSRTWASAGFAARRSSASGISAAILPEPCQSTSSTSSTAWGGRRRPDAGRRVEKPCSSRLPTTHGRNGFEAIWLRRSHGFRLWRIGPWG